MDKSSIRQSALAFRAGALGLSSSVLYPAQSVIDAACNANGLALTALPAGDPLLGGALAMLDRDIATIWLDGSRAQDEQLFTAAHELAHFVRHSINAPGAFNSTDLIDFRGELEAQAAEGYSPQQRRELEANLWAAEFLMPEQAVRSAFLDERLGAIEIATYFGLPQPLVRAQMRSALLRVASAPATVSTVNAPSIASKFVPDLDPSQREAATVEKGPYLLAAGPGTGKTRTLVARCMHLALDRGVAPESILALTFSRKAAIEMRERLIDAGVGTASSGPWVGTFHAFCMETLQRYGHRVGLKPGWRVAGDSEMFAILQRNLMRLGLRELLDMSTPTLHLRDILKAISRAKDELCGPARYTELAADHITDCAGGVDCAEALRLDEVAKIYPIYEQIMSSAKRLDYGDLIMRTVELLEQCPDVRAALNSQFPQVVVDEYQDVNYACARLLKMMGGPMSEGLWAVGDRRQSIYRFRERHRRILRSSTLNTRMGGEALWR